MPSGAQFEEFGRCRRRSFAWCGSRSLGSGVWKNRSFWTAPGLVAREDGPVNHHYECDDLDGDACAPFVTGRVLNTCLYPTFRADQAVREEAEIREVLCFQQPARVRLPPSQPTVNTCKYKTYQIVNGPRGCDRNPPRREVSTLQQHTTIEHCTRIVRLSKGLSFNRLRLTAAVTDPSSRHDASTADSKSSSALPMCEPPFGCLRRRSHRTQHTGEPPTCRDRDDDDVVLATARACECAAIVTGDQDLLIAFVRFTCLRWHALLTSEANESRRANRARERRT